MVSRVDSIRDAMARRGVTAYIIPTGDAHQNEYVPPCWQRRAYVSGFTGSFGSLAITSKKAGLWTDSRYFIQAEAQLSGTGIELFKMGTPGTPTMAVWLQTELGEEETVGIDPELFSERQVKKLRNTLGARRVVTLEQNLVDAAWPNQPPFPLSPAEVWPMEYAGASVAEKLERVRRATADAGAEVLVITTLDAVAWLFNIRGRDVPFCPLLIGYAIVGKDSAQLFIKKEKVTDELTSHLDGVVDILDYDAFESRLVSLSTSRPKVLVDPETVSQWVVNRLGENPRLVRRRSPITDLKAEKNDTELEGFKNAHVRDGVALVRFLRWIEKAVHKGRVTEVSAAEKLAGLRAQETLYRGESFAAISAFGPHGAIVHYDPREGTETPLSPPGIYLIDSGAQYLDGTTDVTRTIALGKPTAEQQRRFTQVLRGHIDLALTAFPAGAFGTQLDTIARKPLWDAGVNYGHGTGHGVGAYLNVHEGPQAISYYRGMNVPLKEGMVLSNEPGFYKEGAFGIRIENLVYVTRDDTRSSDETVFLRLENLTLCPIDLDLVLPELLTREEKDYLNAYHGQVRDTLSPYLEVSDRRWLALATKEVAG